MPALFLKTVLPSTAKGLVSAEQITEMMVAAQKESYADGLASYHPHFWAAKLHFFIDDVPFYNFPHLAIFSAWESMLMPTKRDEF